MQIRSCCTALSFAAIFLCSSNVLNAGWYTRYQNSDAGLTIQFDFNDADGKRVRDSASRRFALLKNVEQVDGWQPVKS